GGPLAGGSLAANFALRDDLAPEAQTRLDAVARDLVERFSDPALDPTRAPGAAGLFTDAGVGFLPANEPGLSQRLRLNSAVDPAQGGAVWRLRDGLGAATPGPLGESSLLTSLQNVLGQARQPASGGFAPGARSLSALAGQMASGVASARLSAETEASFATARSSAMKILELQTSVDTDRELQDLLAIENSYAANAKVVQTVDDMIQILLGI
ncbi:MAG: flagellar basal body rod C-terminal domain-containing protein, partial [Paracoccaceae bacterium]|nr:flagellar basal body rod C-terminal domain-containing protein [Paracoccaceae bacterium]